ncbi:hypothetical protein DVA86_20585 [Streptomyces armeniacus]|uniref:Uncharacterized protein n=1 Tax=Streptomyces armeniacus TaxID=83291 RepID=A0A345XSS5_9ACTN|nr:hypothetical protein [Streptomyces armeniacus]AXK34691.1 hypothetical protein DVA86_20585 [Streptomyces armeniacus]
MTRPPAAVTTAADEPEPQHERDTSNPDQMPPLPRRGALSALAGLVDDIERDDDHRGPEPEPDPVTRPHALARRLVLTCAQRAVIVGRGSRHAGDRRAARRVRGDRCPHTPLGLTAPGYGGCMGNCPVCNESNESGSACKRCGS